LSVLCQAKIVAGYSEIFICDTGICTFKILLTTAYSSVDRCIAVIWLWTQSIFDPFFDFCLYY